MDFLLLLLLLLFSVRLVRWNCSNGVRAFRGKNHDDCGASGMNRSDLANWECLNFMLIFTIDGVIGIENIDCKSHANYSMSK